MAEGGEGPAKTAYPYGEYVGGRDENLDRHGYGSALLPNGDIYEGNYRHGKRHGKGMYCFRNGARYEGEWRKGLKHGFGTFIHPDATKYIGQWRKDNKHGHGIYYYANGDYYEGSWYKGFRHGLGTYTYDQDKVQHYGVWLNGRMDGAGVLTYPCDFRYHGKFKRNLPIGPGIYTFEDKWIQFGFYVNMRDPAFDYFGAEHLALDKGKGGEEEEANADEEEDRASPPGIVPIWRARYTVRYSADLIPPPPMFVPIVDSEDSLLDIMDYLKRHYDTGPRAGQEEAHVESYSGKLRSSHLSYHPLEPHYGEGGEDSEPVIGRPAPTTSPVDFPDETETDVN